MVTMKMCLLLALLHFNYKLILICEIKSCFISNHHYHWYHFRIKIISSELIGFSQALILTLKYFTLNILPGFCVLFLKIIFPIHLFSPFLLSISQDLKHHSIAFHNLLRECWSVLAFPFFSAQLGELFSFRMQLNFRKGFDMIELSF